VRSRLNKRARAEAYAIFDHREALKIMIKPWRDLLLRHLRAIGRWTVA
jgi:hypothetical protein